MMYDPESGPDGLNWTPDPVALSEDAQALLTQFLCLGQAGETRS